MSKVSWGAGASPLPDLEVFRGVADFAALWLRAGSLNLPGLVSV